MFSLRNYYVFLVSMAGVGEELFNRGKVLKVNNFVSLDIFFALLCGRDAQLCCSITLRLYVVTHYIRKKELGISIALG